MRPRVKAFHVLRAMRASANGTSTEALNFNPRRKGSNTFLMKPCSENNILISIATHLIKDLGVVKLY